MLCFASAAQASSDSQNLWSQVAPSCVSCCWLVPIPTLVERARCSMVMHGSCVFVQESAKVVRFARYYMLATRLSVSKSTWSTLKVDTYCLQLAIKALAYLESIHCRVYRLLFPQKSSSAHVFTLSVSLPFARACSHLPALFAVIASNVRREARRRTARPNFVFELECACLSALHTSNLRWIQSNDI